MGKIKEIVVDAENPSLLARFWAEALDGHFVRPYDQAELERLAQHGLTPASDPAVAVDGPGPTLFFQRTRRPKSGRNRVHLDISCRSRAAEAHRLEHLGAAVREIRDDRTIMLDPEGNEFCVVEEIRRNSKSERS